MHLKTRNVNTAFRDLVFMFRDGERDFGRDILSVPIAKRQSRNGPVLMIDEPVTITYTHPNERVLFNASRDANPFFHLYESLWMLAGRNDVEPLAYYASKMMNYSDDGKTLNGAYGYRWRHSIYEGDTEVRNHSDTDQLNIIINHLKADPTSRRTVLQMWNVEDDLLKIGLPCNRCGGTGKVEILEGFEDSDKEAACPHCNRGMKQQSKDVCCNLSVMFSFRPLHKDHRGNQVFLPGGPTHYLDTTVVSRSEDLIWGLLGADYVDFTILQEYMAARLGCEVGLYHHMVNNLHVYESNWKPKEWLEADPVIGHTTMYDAVKYRSIPLITNPSNFEEELPQFVELYKNKEALPRSWKESFFELVAQPMMMAHAAYKNKGATSMMWANQIQSDDWRIACIEWLQRRL